MDWRGGLQRWMRIICLVVMVMVAPAAGCILKSQDIPSLAPTAPGQALPSATLPMTSTPAAPTPVQVMETVSPTCTATVEPTSSPMPTEEVRTVTFTIVYDNNAYEAGGLEALRTSWGFACWVDSGETTVLFDTGGDGATLMHNIEELDLDPLTIDAVVLSHAHRDHTGGLGALLRTGVRPTVYVPASFSRGFKGQVRAHTEVVEVSDPMTVAPGIHTTGEVGTGIREQALAVETRDGLVVITGCAHPGVERMVRRAYEHVDDRIALVVGGFHLGGASRSRVEGIIADFRQLGVKRVAPCHCTGDAARRLFDDAFGEDCTLAGVGWSTEYVLETSD